MWLNHLTTLCTHTQSLSPFVFRITLCFQTKSNHSISTKKKDFNHQDLDQIDKSNRKTRKRCLESIIRHVVQEGIHQSIEHNDLEVGNVIWLGDHRLIEIAYLYTNACPTDREVLKSDCRIRRNTKSKSDRFDGRPEVHEDDDDRAVDRTVDTDREADLDEDRV